MTDRRVVRHGFAVVLAGMIAALVLAPAAAASASLGSVPAQVAAYVADGGMLARLSDVYGKNAAGAGIDFDATTKAGPITRVYEWTAARLGGATTDHPVQLTNNWVVPITIADKPIGLATIWINPQTDNPELADFTATPALATAMAAVPATAALVRDTTTRAWLALAEGTVTPLVAGTSGLSAPVPVTTLKLSAESAPVAAARDPNTGLGLTIGAVGVVVVVIVIVLLLPRRRRRIALAAVPDAAAGPEPAAELAPELAPQPVPVSESVPESVPEPEPEPVSVSVEPVAKPAPKPRAARPATPRPSSPVTKPAGSKPGSRTPTAPAASTKPRTQKPPAQKPPAQKPPAQKPPKPPLEPED